MKKIYRRKLTFSGAILILLCVLSLNANAQAYLEIGTNGWGGSISNAKPAIADIDGDGLLDMLVGDASGKLHHLEQRAIGDTSFHRISMKFNGIDVGDYAAPAITDLDGDGLLDLIIGNYSGMLFHYEQEQQFSEFFALISDNFNSINVGEHSTPTFTDVDGDGLLDLIIGASNGSISYYEQSALQSLVFDQRTANYSTINVGSNSTPALSDMDDNGLLDMIIGSSDGVITHYQQTHPDSCIFEIQPGTFAKIDIGSNAAPFFIDFDSDNLLDLIVGNSGGEIALYEKTETVAHNKWFVLENTNFGNISVDNGLIPCFTDLENDGLIDILVGTTEGTVAHWVQAFEGSEVYYQISGLFNAIDVGKNASPTIIDIDGNGLLDLIIGDYYGTLNHYEQSDTNPLDFTLITTNFNSISISSGVPVFIDLDNNGLLDMIVGNYNGNLKHYQQSETNSLIFTEVSTFINSIDIGIYSAPTFADIDNNGLYDLIIGGYESVLRHYEQTNADSFNFELIDPNFNNLQFGSYTRPSPVLADIDKNGNPELFFGSSNTNWGSNNIKQYKAITLAVSFEKVVNNLFTDNIDFGSFSKPFLYDIDSDGLLDMLVGKQNGGITHLEQSNLNSQEYTLINESFNNLSGSYTAPTITDIDENGLLDLFVGYEDGTLNYYEQNEENSYDFTLKIADFNGIDVSSKSVPCFTDMDNDGLLDLLIGGEWGYLKHYEQIPQNPIVFSEINSNFNNISLWGPAPTISDIGDDGILDLLIGKDNGGIYYYKQVSTYSYEFSLISETYGGINVGSYSTPCVADINGDGTLDMIVGAEDGSLHLYLNYGTACANLLSPENETSETAVNQIFTWSSAQNADGYYVNLGTDNPPTNVLNMHNAGSDTTFTPTNPLDYNQSYFWQIVPYNAVDTAFDCAIYSFTTQTLIEIPAVETFTDCVLPTGWSQETLSGNPDIWSIYNTANAGGEACELMATPISGNGTSRLITPMINTTGMTELVMEFDHKFEDAGSFGLVIFIESSSDGINWTSESWNIISGTGNIGPEKSMITIANNLGNHTYISFTLSGNHNNFTSWSIDNVGFFDATLPPLCTTPILPEDSATNVSLLTGLSWEATANTTGYKIYFGTDNPPTNIENGLDLGDVTEYTPTQALSEDTSYYWKAVPYNTNGDADTCAVWSFETRKLLPPNNINLSLIGSDVFVEWEPPTDHSIYEGFEDEFPPEGWLKLNPDGGTGWQKLLVGTSPLPGWNQGSVTSPPDGGDAQAYCTWNTGGSESNNQWLVSPPLTVEANSILEFYMIYYFNSYADNIEIRISTTYQNDPIYFDMILDEINFNATSSIDWTKYSYNISELFSEREVIYIAFRELVDDNTNDGSAISIDNFYFGGGSMDGKQFVKNSSFTQAVSQGIHDLDFSYDPLSITTRSTSSISYNIHRNDAIIAQNITETIYQDTSVIAGSNSYKVIAVYEDGLSKPAGPAVIIVPYNEPTIYTDPFSFLYNSLAGETFSDTLVVTNVGIGELNYSIEIEYFGLEDWLTIDPVNGNLNLEESIAHDLTINAPYVDGLHSANIKITSNDANTPILIIPVELNVFVPLEARFEADVVYGFPPYEVNFTDLSVGGPLTWKWDFESDGIIDSYEQNPSWVYEDFGLYDVTLIITENEETDTLIKQNYIDVNFQHEAIITSIQDIPDDQGGWVMVNFSRSIYDTDPLQEWGEMYNIEMNSGHGWFNVGNVGAYASNYYAAQVHTSFDSSQYSNGLIDFRVIAIMQEGNYASETKQGYSVDNLAPAVPDNLDYTLMANEVTINWSNCPDHDFDYFAIYKSDVSGVFTETPFATSTQAAFADQLAEGEVAYYVITAIDFHGNESNWSDEVETSPAMRWELKEGWSGISSFIDPSDADVESMFAAIQSKLIILQNDEGMYWPGQNVNTLGNWNMDAGYKIKVSENTNLTVSGSRLQNQTLAMAQSWNLMPVLSECDADVAELFAGKNLTIVKEVAGWRTYWPEFGINTLGELAPGKAYFALMNSEEEIVFPECDGMKFTTRTLTGFETLSELNTPWDLTNPTAISHNIAIPASANSNNLFKVGDIIGVFDVAGNCFGLSEWNGSNTALTAFGDDPLTNKKDGFEPGEFMMFKLFRPEDESEFVMEVEFNSNMSQSGAFAENGLSAISGIKAGATGINNLGQVQQVQIHPNPASDAFTLSLESTPQSKGNLELYNLKGQLMLKVEISSKSTQVEVKDLPAGVYIASIKIDNQTLNKRIIKN